MQPASQVNTMHLLQIALMIAAAAALPESFPRHAHPPTSRNVEANETTTGGCNLRAGPGTFSTHTTWPCEITYGNHEFKISLESTNEVRSR